MNNVEIARKIKFLEAHRDRCLRSGNLDAADVFASEIAKLYMSVEEVKTMYNSDLFDIDMAIEEAGELIVALSKLKRNKINDITVRVSMDEALNGVIEEIADVRYTVNKVIKDFKLDENEILNTMVDKKHRTQELKKKKLSEAKPLPTYWQTYEDEKRIGKSHLSNL